MEINFWAIIAATTAAMIIGGLWYSPLLFGKAWMKLAKVSKKDMDNPVKSYIGAFFITAVTIMVIAMFMGLSGLNSNVKEVMLFAATLWLGFSASMKLGGVLWKNKPLRLFFIDTFYDLVYFEVAAIIVFYMR